MHLLGHGSKTISSNVPVLELGRGHMTETKALGSSVEGTSRAIRITVTLPMPIVDQWYPFAYEVEPPIPIVLRANKYSQRQSQA